MLAVHLDALRLGYLPPQDAVDEVLQVVEPVAVAADDRLAVRRVDLDARPRWPNMVSRIRVAVSTVVMAAV
jgi:hypothetical protein